MGFNSGFKGLKTEIFIIVETSLGPCVYDFTLVHFTLYIQFTCIFNLKEGLLELMLFSLRIHSYSCHGQMMTRVQGRS